MSRVIVLIKPRGEAPTGGPSRTQLAAARPFSILQLIGGAGASAEDGYRTKRSRSPDLPENGRTLERRATRDRQSRPDSREQKRNAGVVLVFRDITERQRMDDNGEGRPRTTRLPRRHRHARFQQAAYPIIGNISPLRSASAYESWGAPPVPERAIRARDLAQQLLTFARGGAPIKKTASIGKLIQDTVSFSLRGSHSRSEFHFGADLWPAEIDPGQISQVIANLVVNADQAMPNGGTLRVSCENFSYDGKTEPTVPDLVPGDYIRISIKDEGIGISEHYLKRIFDPYFTTKSHGNGLGWPPPIRSSRITTD